MCGIYGIAHHQRVDYIQVKKSLNQILSHRGPDDQQDKYWDGLYFYHARLAIQDIQSGIQPMDYGPYTVVFNGEIYNHLELREKFALTCRTRSDTETLLQLYAKLGEACVSELDGMFAFALYDKQARTIFLARDRMGEKPLYYYDQKGLSFAFSSELNALYLLADQKPRVSQSALNNYVQQSFLCGEETPYEQVKELLPGHQLTLHQDALTYEISSYWSINTLPDQHLKITQEKEALKMLDQAFQQVIEKQLKTSDIEVGTFLSGGIDSSLVTAYAKKYSESLRSFTVCFEGAYDEGPLAKKTAAHLGTKHHELSISFKDLPTDIFSILGAYGEPYADDSAIPSWYVSREAKKHLAVILTGDGADELFAGYRRYVPQKYFDIYQTEGNFLTRKMADATSSFSNDKKSLLNYIHRLLVSINKSPIYTYLSSTTDAFTSYEEAMVKVSDHQALEKILRKINGLTPCTALERALLFDLNVLLPGVLLPKMDIAAMQHALETRAPFLSFPIVEFAQKLSPSLKIKGKTTKYLLRKLAEQHLPTEIIHQPKRGFEIPLKDWMNGILKDLTHDLVSSSSALSKDFVESNYLHALLQDQVAGLSKEKRAKQLFTLLGLEIWDQKRRSLV